MAVKTLLASLLLGAAALSASCPAVADNLSPSAAANDSLNYGFSPNGVSGFLTVNWWDGSPNVGLLQFDLSAYAPGTVSSAVLDLYHLWNSAPGAQYGIFRNTSNWVGVTTDYASRPATASLPAAILSINDGNSEVHRTVDLTTLVQGWVNGAYGNDGLTLQRLDDPNPLVYFIANSASSGGYPGPVLMINAVPEPHNVAMLLAGLGVLAGALRRKVV
jgi:hypothetical protein